MPRSTTLVAARLDPSPGQGRTHLVPSARRRRTGRADIRPLTGKDRDFDDVDPAEAEADFTRLREEWRLADEAVAGMDFDETFDANGGVYSVPMVYVHVIGEYARHNGHADLLRESLDGPRVDSQASRLAGLPTDPPICRVRRSFQESSALVTPSRI